MKTNRIVIHSKLHELDIDNLLLIIGKDLLFIKFILNDKDKFYGKKEVIKNGKLRLTTPPLYGLMLIQSLFNDYLKTCIQFPKFVHGWVKKGNPKTNAEAHIRKTSLLTLDIENFFPSVSKSMVLQALIKCGIKKDVAILIAELCTHKNSLPQGSPTSPLLANLVFSPTDERILDFCKKRKLTYTRYGDDMSFSGNKSIHPYFHTIQKYVSQAGFKLAHKKTQFMGRDKTQIVTQLVVNETPRPRKEFISETKKTIRKSWTNPTEKINKNSIWGKIAHIKSYNKKMGREVRGLLTKPI